MPMHAEQTASAMQCLSSRQCKWHRGVCSDGVTANYCDLQICLTDTLGVTQTPQRSSTLSLSVSSLCMGACCNDNLHVLSPVHSNLVLQRIDLIVSQRALHRPIRYPEAVGCAALCQQVPVGTLKKRYQMRPCRPTTALHNGCQRTKPITTVQPITCTTPISTAPFLGG